MSKNTSPIGGYYPTSSNTSSSSSGTSSGTATQSPDPAAAYTYLLGLQNALGIAATPYQPYEGQMVAGFTPSQIAAQTGFQNAVGMSSPYYTAAQDLYNQGLQYQTNAMLPTASNYYGQAIGTASPGNYNVEPYMNPYQQSVVDATMNQLKQTQENMLGKNTQQSVLRGSYGGSGQALGRAEIARQQALSNAETLAKLNAQNYLNAQEQYNTQQRNQMQAYQAAAQGLGALGSSQQAQAAGNIQNLAAGMGALGTQAQQSYLQALAALQQSGATEQQLQQAQLSNAYQQFLQAKAYPYQQASYLSGLASGLGPLLGATSSQNTSQNSTGTGSQLGMQPYQNQSGGGGLFGGLTSLLGLGLKAFMPGMKDGGRVTDRNHYAAGGSAEDDSEDFDFGSEVGRSSPYSARKAPAAAGLGSLIAQQPYSSPVGNYATDALKLAKVIPSAKQVAQERLLEAISQAISGTPDPNKAQAEYARQQSLAPVSREITSSFFGAQEPSSSGLGGLGESLKSSRREDDDEDEDTNKKTEEEKGGFGSLLSGVKNNLSSLLNTEDGDLFASGGRVGFADGGDAATPQGISPQEAQNYVANLYRTQLAREGEKGGMDYWTNQLQKGLNTKEGVAGLFAASPERQILPQTSANYIKNLYQSQLGRQGDQGGFNYWTDQMQKGLTTQEDIAKQFAGSPEGKGQIENLYRTIMNRDPEAAGAQYWQDKLGSGMSLADITKSFNAAPEAASARNAQNQITTMFQGALGRDPNTAEVRQWTESLNAGQPLSDLSRQLSTTPAAQSKLADIYQQYLGQDPDATARDKLSALMAQGMPLSSIADAVRTSPEARQYDISHPGIVGDPARRTPKTINALMETPESIAFNKKMNPTGRSGAGFEALMAQAYANSPGPQLSPVQQGMPAMPDQSYYTKPLPNYLPRATLAAYPPADAASGGDKKTAPILGYLNLAQTAADQDPTAFINNLYGQYTGRNPTDEQLASGVAAINAGTSRQALETDIAKTTPAQNQAFVAQLYNQTFGRAPEPEGLKYWTDQLAKGMPASQIAAYFARSPEQQSTSVVQGYMPQITDTRINPYTGLANLSYVAPFRSQPVPYAPGFKDGGRVGRYNGGKIGSRERIELAAKAALQAGASPKQAAMMAAISVPESAGNPYAHNPNARTGDNSYGLWQINMLGGMGPERRRQFGLARNEELFDPLTNARAALKIAQGRGGLNNWTTYKAGKHLPYYSTAVDVVNNLVKDPSAVMAKIVAPAPLTLPTKGGAPNSSSVMYNTPSSPSEEAPSQSKGLQLSDLLENIVAPAMGGQPASSEGPKLAQATAAPIIPLAEPMPMKMPFPNLGDDNRERYLDTVIAMNQRARGGRLHFQDGGTDDESRDRFLREQLEGSAPQYDPEAGQNTAERMGELGLNLAALLPAGRAIKPIQNAYKMGKGALNALRNMRRLSGAEESAEPGLGALEYQPQAPRGRQPSPAGEPIPMGIKTKPGMNRFESNTEGMRRNIPGNEIFQWSSLRDPKGSRPMNKFEENQANLNWNRFGQYEPNKAPAYYDKFGNVAPPKVNYDGKSQRPIPPLEANQNYYPGRIPGNDLRAGSAGRAPTAGRGFFSGKPEFTSAELGQELATQGGRGMSVPPSRLPATRSNLPTLASGARGGGNGEPPIYADYRDVTGNILGGPRGGGNGPTSSVPITGDTRLGRVPETGGSGRIPPTGKPRGDDLNWRRLGTEPHDWMSKDIPPFNPNITSEMPTPKLTDYYKLDQVAQDRPKAAPKRAPARKAAPEDNRRYWGDWRDTAGFEEDPIGNFLDSLTGDRKVARKRGTINSPMSPYAGETFANGGRAYRGDGGFLDSLGDTLSTGLSNLRSSKDSPISEGLITAGLGMMASPQHNPLRAIGEGGLTGIQAYNTARARQRARQAQMDELDLNKKFSTDISEKLRQFGSPEPLTPMRRGGPARPMYANGGQAQSDNFDPFEALSSIGDTIGSGLSSLGETIGDALMPKAEAAVAQDREPSAAPTRRSQASPISDALITAGLGMMASPSHNPLRAIGEGGLRGVQAYNTSMEEQRKEDKLAAEKAANTEFIKTMAPGAPAPEIEAPKIEKTTAIEPAPAAEKATEKKPAVVAQDQPAFDPVQQARREYEVLLAANPTNKWQQDWVKQHLRAAEFKLRYALDEQKAAGKSGPSKGESEFQKEFAKEEAKSVSGELLKNQETVEAADREIPANQELITALQTGKLGTGKIGSRAEYEYKKNAPELIGGDKEYARLGNTLDSLSVKSMLDAFNGRLSTGVTDEDRRAIMKIVPSFDQTADYNIDALQVKNAALERAKKMNDWIRDEYLPSHDGSIQPDFRQKLREWSHSQPRLVPERLAKVLDEGKKSKDSSTKGEVTSDPNVGYTKDGRQVRRYSDGSIKYTDTGELYKKAGGQ